MRILRDGGQYSVYAKARRYARLHLTEFDVIIDEINTVPFRAHNLGKKRPVVAVIHQLAREIWFYETRFPVNLLGYYVLEPVWLRGYRNVPTITVSNSTRKDLLDRGFSRVRVVHNGIGVTPLREPPAKESNPILIFMGRLVRSKLPGHALAAFKQFRAWFPNAEMWVLGDGYMKRKLEKAGGLGVRFFGRVDDKEKYDLLKRAHVLLVPSVREGWGISVIEANAMGTPAVGYMVPGLVDSITHEETGILVPPFDYQAMSSAARRILLDYSNGARFSNNSLKWSRNFDWDQAAGEFHNALESVRN
jgi:glycosyltransferase involved in cell wall biosynthesis